MKSKPAPPPFALYLLKNRRGKPLLYYQSLGRRRVVCPFPPAPSYTAKALLADALFGFAAARPVGAGLRASDPIVALRFADGCFCGLLRTARMDLPEGALFREFKRVLKKYCEQHGYGLYIEEDRMEITDYVNSKDIREYWKEIGYEPPPNAAAWLIWQGKNQTVKEKHRSFWNVIDSTEDVPVPLVNAPVEQASLHRFLERYTALEAELIEAFYRKGEAAVYTCRACYGEAGELGFGAAAPVFADFEEAYAHTVGDGASSPPDLLEIAKTYLGSEGKQILVTLNAQKEEVRVMEDAYITDARDVAVLHEVFPHMRVAFPTPFQKGDTVRLARSRYARCGRAAYVIASVCEEDGSSVWGYTLARRGKLRGENVYRYMDLEYEHALTAKEALLRPISQYLKGEVDLGFLLGAHRSLLLRQEASMANLQRKEHDV